jgi:4-diphosphocytidyl-2-C-methyl-D-erythritol kinase
MTLKVRANAKLNLGLRITGRRADGYHLLHTLFQEIDFCDELQFSKRDDHQINLKMAGPTVESITGSIDSNLCYLAAALLQREFDVDRGVDIFIEKVLPVGAGLGGGSSDAATTLRALIELWQLEISPARLIELATSLGADVPLFLAKGLQLGEGIGEILTPLNVVLDYHIIMLIPSIHISTPWAYKQFAGRTFAPAVPRLDNLITADPIDWSRFANDFEEVVFPAHPQLAGLKQLLLDVGADYASMSGSGATVFGLFKQWPDLEAITPNDIECRIVITRAVKA